MFIDSETLLADGTWAPTATGDNISTNVLDTGPLSGTTANAGRDLGMGEDLWFQVVVTQTVTSGGAATVDFRFRTAAAAALTASPTDLVASGAIPKATLVAGYMFRVKVPSSGVGGSGYLRYVGANANIGTAVLTAGKFHVSLVKNVQANTKYAGNYALDA